MEVAFGSDSELFDASTPRPLFRHELTFGAGATNVELAQTGVWAHRLVKVTSSNARARVSTKLHQRVVARTAEVARSNGGDRTEVLPCYPMFGICRSSGRTPGEH